MEKQKIKQFGIIQPNTVTNARYEFSKVQKNLLYHIIDKLQHRMNKKNIGEVEEVFEIKIKQLNSDGHYDRIIKDLEEMRKKTVRYKITKDAKTWLVVTGLISAFKYEEDGNSDFNEKKVKIYVSSPAIPFLCYIGSGFTVFQKTVALSLKSIFSKRIYELCCRWQDKGGFTMPLEEFREIMGVKNKFHTMSNLRRKVLDHAKKELLEHSDITFEYSLDRIKSRSFNFINIKINSNKIYKDPTKGNTSELYRKVYGYLCQVYPKYIDGTAIEITDKMAQNDQLRTFHERLERLDDDLTSGKLNGTEHFSRLVKKILKEDYDISY